MERFIGALSLTLLLSGLAAVVQVSPSQNSTPNLLNAEILPALKGDLAQADAAVSRAELANILVTTFKLRSAHKTAAVSALADVPTSHWAYKDIQTVVEKGIMTVYPGEKFLPDRQLTRAEAFSVLAKAAGSTQQSDQLASGILANYADSHQVPRWARQPIASALHRGLVNIRSDQRIDPLSTMTRADIAYALRKYHLQEIPSGLRRSLSLPLGSRT
ncbi:S-layer homology domain-containing protein [Leptolyngbya ohadii]|uniref:S-layer homology domain-containing protein n=1 Tax=Leptolyngbya ohadii TaxID=1962290 RepID=UPI000B59E8C0|nr:S-layer homology domain-containing protein [Leptolyngbya ohadii]